MSIVPPDKIRDLYNQTARQYQKKYEKSLYWYEETLKKTIDYLEKYPADTVIDIGCGPGHILRRLAARFPKIRFIGVDFSAEMIRIAEASAPPPNVRFEQSDAVSWIRRRLEEAHPRERVLCLVIGAMEFYGPEDDFTLAVRDLWRGVGKGALLITFHNASLLGRYWIRRPSKQYWLAEQAVKFFTLSTDRASISYRSFVLWDALALVLPSLDRFLLLCDRLTGALPRSFRKKTSTLMELMAVKAS